MIVDLIVEIFQRIGHTWTIGGEDREVTAEDVQTVLDEAVKVLYARPRGQQFEVGGLIIEQRPDDTNDLWCYLGNFR